MNDKLNTGTGQCQGTSRLSIIASEAVAEMHAGHDILHRILNAVHHINRHAPPDDFIAVGLPSMHLSGKRRLALPHLSDRDNGTEKQIPTSRDLAELIGSEASLKRLLDCDCFAKLSKLEALEEFYIDVPLLEAGDMGVAYIRDRSTGKIGPAKLRRMQKRAEQFGRSFTMPDNAECNDPGLCAFHYGGAVIKVRNVAGVVSGSPVPVSTYGFSRLDAPAFLPILPVVPADIISDEIANAA